MIFSIFFSTVGGVIAAVNGYTFLNPDTMLTAGMICAPFIVSGVLLDIWVR